MRDEWPWRRQMTMHAHVTRQRSQLRAGRNEMNAERQVRRRQAIRRPRAKRHVPVIQPRRQLRDPEPANVFRTDSTRSSIDAVVTLAVNARSRVRRR
jgi:hypothetical protein